MSSLTLSERSRPLVAAGAASSMHILLDERTDLSFLKGLLRRRSCICSARALAACVCVCVLFWDCSLVGIAQCLFGNCICHRPPYRAFDFKHYLSPSSPSCLLVGVVDDIELSRADASFSSVSLYYRQATPPEPLLAHLLRVMTPGASLACHEVGAPATSQALLFAGFANIAVTAEAIVRLWMLHMLR
jgi:hypothetical protein